MKYFIYVIIAAVVVLGIVFLVNQSESPESTDTQQQQSEENSDQADGTSEPVNLPERPILNTLLNAQSTMTAALVAVDDSNSSGIGYKAFIDGTFYHSVDADMPDPAPGAVYEGWLVQTQPLQFFSTGVMTKQADGTWALDYQSNTNPTTYNRVVITEETVVDDTPEAHIIEGDFN